MKRSILFSLMAIGGAIALVVGASSFAAFTATDAETGSVTAGTLTISVDNGEGSDGLTFNLGDALCPADMAPGDDCVAEAQVENTGSVYAEVDGPPVVTVDSLDEDCPDGYWSGSADLDDGDVIAPGDTLDFTVTVSLDSDAPNGCQDVTATATVTVNVASIPTPDEE